MPLTRWRLYKERAQQKRKALRMLALSGVVRPSHIELRYCIPILKIGAALQATTSSTVTHQSTRPPQPSVTIGTGGTQLLQWVRLAGSISRRLVNP